jgi:hypothetical protein
MAVVPEPKICAECGTEVVPPGRRLFCSEKCYRRNNSRTTGQAARERKRRERELIEVVHGSVTEIMNLRRHWGKQLGWTLNYRYEGYGYNDHRPYGWYEWTDTITSPRQRGKRA